MGGIWGGLGCWDRNSWGWVREGSGSPLGQLCPPEDGGAGPGSQHAHGEEPVDSGYTFGRADTIS